MLDKKSRLVIALSAIAAAITLIGINLVRDDTPTVPLAALAATMADVSERFPELPHISVPEVAEKLKGGDLVVFDVRQEQEYEVSHLPGAIHVDPAIDRAAFVSRFGDQVKDKDVLFYCSVGMRSSTLAADVKDALKARGASGVYDMAGGIFAWHSESRPLHNAGGATDYVHPYSDRAKRLLVRSELARMSLKEAAAN